MSEIHVRGPRTSSAVLFDLDGVVVDSRNAIAGCVNHALEVHGHARRPERELHRFIGPPLASCFAELLGEPADSPGVRASVLVFRQRYAAILERETTVVPGIADALRELSATHRLAVATSKPLTFARQLLSGMGLIQLFDVIAGPALSAPNEGKAATIGAALGQLGSVRAVMVGDRSFDVIAAHAHALPVIGVGWGIGTHEELEDAGADIIIDAPSQLAAAVEELSNQIE